MSPPRSAQPVIVTTGTSGARVRAAPVQAFRGMVGGATVALVAGWIAQVAIRLWLTRDRTAPMVYPDEAGYLIAARWLAGGPGADLSGYTFYRAGYALLLMPARLLGDDPQTAYRFAMGVNAAVGACVFPLGAALLRRCGVEPRRARPLAWVLALLPATTLFGQGALADAVLPALILAWLLALDRFVRTGSAWAGVAASVAAAYAYSAHPRGAVVVAVHTVVLSARAVRATPRRAAVVSLAVTGTGVAAAALLNRAVREGLYPAGPAGLGAVLRDHLTRPAGQLWAVSGAVGQWWAVLCGTWGLAGLGLCGVLAVVVRRHSGVPVADADRVMAGVLLATTAGIAYASSAALPDEHRVGNYAYGRYLSCLALVYALIGAAVLLRRERLGRYILATISMIVIGALWVRLYGGQRLAPGHYRFIGWDLPEIGLLGGGYTRLRPAVTAVVASFLLLLWWGLRRPGAAALATGLLMVNLFASLVTGWALARPYGPARPLGTEVSAGGVAMDNRITPQAGALNLLPARLELDVGWTPVRRFDARGGPPPPDVCTVVVPPASGGLAADSWPAHPAGWSYHEIIGSLRAGIGRPVWIVWRAPSCPWSG